MVYSSIFISINFMKMMFVSTHFDKMFPNFIDDFFPSSIFLHLKKITVLATDRFFCLFYFGSFHENNSNLLVSATKHLHWRIILNVFFLIPGFLTPCSTPNLETSYCTEIQKCPPLYEAWQTGNRDFVDASKCGPQNENLTQFRVCCGNYRDYVTGTYF